MSDGVPPPEVTIDSELVRGLLAAQHPDLAHEPLEVDGEGWDCVMVRIGRDRAARLPRRKVAAELVELESRWLPTLAPRLPLPTPAMERRGLPGAGYPWRWSIVPWFEGASVDRAELGDGAGEILGRFLAALHGPAPADAPRNPWRGVPLTARAEAVEGWLAALAARPDALEPATGAKVRAIWERALATPMDLDPTWLHGDLHPRNVIARDGAIVAVVDWGDMCRGDRATDLASLWTVLPSPAARQAAYAIIEARTETSPDLWARARGWAVFFGAILLKAGLDDGDVPFAAAGRGALQRVSAEA